MTDATTAAGATDAGAIAANHVRNLGPLVTPHSRMAYAASRFWAASVYGPRSHAVAARAELEAAVVACPVLIPDAHAAVRAAARACLTQPEPVLFEALGRALAEIPRQRFDPMPEAADSGAGRWWVGP
ncbi:MAG: hypothetical protein IM628_10640 [Phenylobacterium sp.]|uniref:hypothetical protein n=1 Tax=Phenylobacterium sp. TaxID=1871053 RepID=UPI0025DDD9D5|nr:hypothetical protein [Phenylobacterium sp.]MCA6305258.1 hypothetical protein [Phenylobacterium sp.]